MRRHLRRLQRLRDDKPLPGCLHAIAEALRPAYELSTRRDSTDPTEAMAKTQVELIADDLRTNQDLAPLASQGNLAVVSAYYHLHTGQVEILNGAPA
ncbi:hypothetical protein GCM10009850_074780 [Nonomuraea monospora]|uniref:Carbonic anhydrase n=2 Tax=Nonomuraea monospora TaxID=568818 RepID=A0ABP5PLK2_9ACTN